MKRIGWTLVLLLMCGGLVFAMQDAAEGDGEEMVQPSLETYAGLAALTLIIVGAIKKMAEKWSKGKEPFLAIGVPILLGVVSKLAGLGFSEISWSTHVLALLLSGIGAQLGHDKLLNPVIKRKKLNPSA